jgi:hypothetical protein
VPGGGTTEIFSSTTAQVGESADANDERFVASQVRLEYCHFCG